MKIKCQECKQERYAGDFYRAIREKKNKEGVYEPYIICKECIIEEYLNHSENNFSKGLLHICDKYNVYYDVNLLNMISINEIPDLKVLFNRYIYNISSLRQYVNLKFKDSVFTSTKEFNEYLNGKTDIGRPVEKEQIEKSDIDFLNEDIKKIKGNLKKANFNNDPNAHGKWINSLRDALELKNKLDDKSKWKEFSSHYYEGDKAIKGENEYISLWKQNGNDDIRNHRIFKVEKEIKKDSLLNDDTLDKIEDIIGYKIFTREYGHTDNIGNIFNDIGGAWNSISQDQQVEIIKLLNKQ